jgi:DNA-binding XRE family transcriptional regulator
MRDLRESVGATQEPMGMASGVPRDTISAIGRGRLLLLRNTVNRRLAPWPLEKT